MSKKLNIRKEDLYELYIQQNLTTKEIAERYHAGISTIEGWLKRYNIKKDRAQTNANITKANNQDSTKEKRRATCLERYGVDSVSRDENIKQKIIEGVNKPESKEKYRQTCLERFGVSSPAKNEEIKKKIKETYYENHPDIKYRRDHPKQPCTKEEICEIMKEVANRPEVKEKRRLTLLEKYGVEYCSQSNEVQQKIIQTNLEKYGVPRCSQSDEIKERVKQTCLEKYGYPSVLQVPEFQEKIKETNLQKYGCENPAQNSEVQQRMRQTNIERYGVPYIMQNEEKQKEITAKANQAIKEKYGVDNIIHADGVLEKIYAKKKQNHSFATSKPEEQYYELLLTQYPKEDIKRQYSDERYPFNCDFYIKSEDKFIELNIHWTHGFRPYDPNDSVCQQQLVEWEEKTNKSEFYKQAIKIWTIVDPLKLETAKLNHLNYEVIYTI